MIENKKTTYIKLFATINGDSTNPLMNIIDGKLREGTKKFVLLISSPGGNVFHGLSTYNYLRGIPAEIETHNFGSVDSIGVIIFLAGRKRYSVRDARFLLHPVAISFPGNVRMEEKQLDEAMKGLHIDIENIASVIASGTKKSEKEIEQAMSDRTTLSPEQAIEFGLVHEIKQELLPEGADLISINMSK